MALPFKDMTAFDFSGVVFSQFPPGTLEDQARMKIEMSIMDSVEDEIASYKKQYLEGKSFTPEQQKEWDNFFKEWRETECVISPWTINMFFFRQGNRELEAMKPWDVESMMMDEYPGRFYPRYKINLENPNAKQFDEDDVVHYHKDGRIEYKGKKPSDWDELEFKHKLEMEKLVQQTDKEVAVKVVEEGVKKEEKSHYNLVFFGNVLDGL